MSELLTHELPQRYEPFSRAESRAVALLVVATFAQNIGGWSRKTELLANFATGASQFLVGRELARRLRCLS